MSWLKTLFSGNKAGTPPAETWNAQGRAHFATSSDAMMNYYCFGDPCEFGDDPRTPEAAQAVITEVMALNRAGRWQEARGRFDPAHVPFIPLLDTQGQNLSCVTAIGPDACVLRLGTPYQAGDTVCIRDGGVTPLPGVLSIAASPNHDWLVIATEDGFHLRRELDAPDQSLLPWPFPAERLDHLRLSNDGQRLVLGHPEAGVFIGDFTLARWTKLHPSEPYLAELRARNQLDEDYWSGDMLNWDLSPDGQFVAFGDQCYSHAVMRIDADLKPHPWSRVGPASAYPHFACFAGDSRHLALNGCHFYGGMTLGIDVLQSQGLNRPDYSPDPRTPVIEDILRVYAATWLPPEALEWHDNGAGGAFALAGAGFLTAVTPAGKVLFSQHFGSSASSIDYCPRTRRLYLGSYSGMLHVYDVTRDAEAGQTYGHRPRHELYRWVLWKDHAPFRW